MADAETLSKRAIERLKNRGFTSGRLEEYQPIYEYADEGNSKFSNRAGWLLHGTTESAVEIKNKSLILRSAFSKSAGKALGSDAEHGISFTQFFPVAASYAESHYSDSHNKPPVIMRLDRSVMQSPGMHLTPLNHWAERVFTRSVSRSKDSFSVEFPRGSFEIFRPKGPSLSKYAEQTKKLWLTPPQELIQKVFGRLFQVAATYMPEENQHEPLLDITPGGTQFWTVFANRVRSGEINLAELTGPSARMAVKERVGDPKVASEIEYFFGSKLNAMGAVVKDIQDKIGKQNWNLALDRAKSKASQVAGNIGKFGLVFAGELLAQEALASGASAAGFNSDAEVLDALKTKLDQITTTSGVRSHPADLSMQGSIQANPPRMKPGDKDESELMAQNRANIASSFREIARDADQPKPSVGLNVQPAGPDLAEESDRLKRWEETLALVNNYPKFRAGKMLYNQMMAVLNWTQRLVMTQVLLAEDPRATTQHFKIPASLGSKMFGFDDDGSYADIPFLNPIANEKNWEVWKEHHASEEAKGFQASNLQTVEPFGRLVFTAYKLGNSLFDAEKYPVSTAAEMVLTDELGRRFGIKSVPMLKQLRTTFNSDDYYQFAKDFGPIAIDLPLQFPIIAVDPMLGAMTAFSSGARVISHAKSVFSSMGKSVTRQNFVSRVLTEFGGAPFTEHALENLYGMAKKGEVNRAAVSVAGMGAFKLGSVWDSIAGPWWRKPKTRWSPAMRRLIAQNEIMSAKVNAEFNRAVMLKDEHMNLLRSMTPEERVDTFMALSSYDTVEKFTYGVINGQFPPTSKKVVDAFNQLQQIASESMLKQMDPKWWKKMLNIRHQEIDQRWDSYRKYISDKIATAYATGKPTKMLSANLAGLKGISAKDMVLRGVTTHLRLPTPAMYNLWFKNEATLKSDVPKFLEKLSKMDDSQIIGILDDFENYPDAKALDDLGIDFKSIGLRSEKIRKAIKKSTEGTLKQAPGKISRLQPLREFVTDEISGEAKTMQRFWHSASGRVALANKIAKETPAAGPDSFRATLRRALLVNLRELFKKVEGEAGLLEKHGANYIEEVLLPIAEGEIQAAANLVSGGTGKSFYEIANTPLTTNLKLATAGKEIERLRPTPSGEFAGDVPTKLEQWTIRRLMEKPAAIAFYWLQVPVKEIQTGEQFVGTFDNLQSHANFHMNWKTAKSGKGVYRNFLRSTPHETILARYEKLVEGLGQEVVRTENKFRYETMLKACDEELARMEGLNPSLMRDDIISAIKEMRSKTEAAAKGLPPAKEKGYIKFINLVHNTVKQGMILLPFPWWVVSNIQENFGKGFAQFGFRAFQAPNVYGIDGSDLRPLFYKGDEIAGKFGAAGTDAKSLFEMWGPTKKVVDWAGKSVAGSEESSRVLAGTLAYHATIEHLQKNFPDMPVDEMITAAVNAGRQIVDKVQFFLEEIAPHQQALDKAIPFWEFGKKSVAFWTDTALTHPRIATAFLNARDKISESNVRGDLRLDVGNGVTLGVESAQGYTRILSALQNTPGLTIDPKEEPIAKNMRAVTALAGNIWNESPFIGLAGALMSPAWNNLVHGDPEFHSAAASVLWKLNSIAAPAGTAAKMVQPLTGQRSLPDIIMSMGVLGEEERSRSKFRLRSMATELKRASEIDAANGVGKPLSIEQAEEKLLMIGAGETLARRFLGLDLKLDQTGSRMQIQRISNVYKQMQDSDMRSGLYYYLKGPEGKPFLEHVVPRPEKPPFSHPDFSVLEEFQKAPDEKRIEMLREVTPRERDSIFKNLYNSIHDLRLKFPWEELSYAGDFTPDKSKDMDKDLQRAIADTSNPMDKKSIADRAVYDPDTGGFHVGGWTRTLVMDKSKTLAEQDQTARLSTDYTFAFNSILDRFAAAIAHGSRDELNDLKTKKIPVARLPDGRFRTLDPKIWFFKKGESGKPVLYETITTALREGGPRRDGTFARMQANTVLKNLQMWLYDETLPKSFLIEEQKSKEASNRDIQPLLKRMEDTVRYPSSANNAAVLAYKIDKALSEGDTAFAPKDFYSRALNSGIPGVERTFAEFAVARKAELLDSLYTALRPKGKFSEKIAENYVAYGWGPEIQMLAAHDKDINRFVEDHGGTMDSSVIYGEELLKFNAERGLPINREIFIKADVAVPDVDRFASFPDQYEPHVLPAGTQPFSGVDAEAKAKFTPKAENILMALKDVGPEFWTRAKPKEQYIPTRPPRTLPGVEFPQFGAQSSMGDFARMSAVSTARFNEANKEYEARMKKLTKVDIPEEKKVRTNIFAVAAANLKHQDPAVAARGAASIMQLGNAIGFIGSDELRVIYRGINQASMMGAGESVADFVLTVGGNAAAWAKSRGLPKSEQTSWVHPRDRIGPMTKDQAATDAMMTKAGMAGSFLTMASGFAAEAGAPEEASIGMGAAGGALQGAVFGAKFGPWGAPIGAILGAALGGFLGSQGKDEKEDRYAEMRELQKARLKQEIANAAERQQAFREDRASREIQSRERALNVRQSQPQDARQQLYKFLRRPTFASSQGLVRQVEGSMARTFTPRW